MDSPKNGLYSSEKYDVPHALVHLTCGSRRVLQAYS